jgi:hypothetical protein
MIFENDFNSLREEDIELLNSYFDGYDYQSSGYTFISNYIWREPYKITWQIIGEYLCMAALTEINENYEEYVMSFPMTSNGVYDPKKLRETIEESRRIFESKGQKFFIGMVPDTVMEALNEAMGEDIVVQHDRDDDDYVYLREDLVNLSGRKFHQKKNHLNYFLRNYEFEYQEATVDMVPEIMRFIAGKNEYKLGETPEEWREVLELETDAIEELLSFVGKGLLTGIIRINGKIEAVTLGEFAKTNSKESVIVHVEKADDRIRGLYQAINNEFCKRLPEETIFVNREEDMGLENLRKTKLSYKPVKMVEKYTVMVK